jgi:DNA-binding NtrC family response regulator
MVKEEKDILLVEDDIDTLEGWAELLKDAGYRVSGASSYEEGRRRLDSPVDMLITDIRLGEYNGLQLVVQTRAAHPNIPVIVLTAHHDLVLKSEAERFNAVYMLKPVRVDQMLACIAEMLEATTKH